MMKCQKKRLIILAAIMLLCIVTGCSAQVKDTPDAVKYLDSDDFVTNGEYIEFPCEYGTLKYPAKWSNSLAIECRKSDGGEIDTFYYVDGEKKAEIARLSFGSEDGFQVGKVKDCEISLRLGDIQSEQWSESDVLNYCAMQEDMNETLACLTELEGFTQS